MFWRPGLHPGTLPVVARPARVSDEDALDFAALAARISVLKADVGEQVLLSDASNHLQLAVRSGSVLEGPVRLSYQVGGPRHIERRLQAVQRLVTLWTSGRLPPGPRPSRHRVERWRLAVRALDLQRAGLSQREIAEVLFGSQDTQRAWRRFGDYLRGRMRRILGLGSSLSAGGYRRLLNS